MVWQSLNTVPLDFGTGISGARACAIANALTRYVLPLVRLLDGRAEPLATAALFVVDGRVLLLTCKHALDQGVAVGDLGVPLASSNTIFWLRRAQPRVLEHPQRDLACIALAPRAAAVLFAHWRAAPLRIEQRADASARTLAVAGYPYAQMRRAAQIMYAKPVVWFTRGSALAATGDMRLHYRRVATRIDGIEVHTPPLDGVSGATCWALTDEDGHDGCVLLPIAVQFAFKHDEYARAEPVHAAAALIDRLKN
jgi:hypothetical protein